MIKLNNILQYFKPTQTAVTVPVGGYESAQNYSTDRSYLHVEQDSSLDTPEYARSEILRLSRYIVRNYAIAERILTVCENYAVGNGLLAQAATDNYDTNDKYSTYFDNWQRSPFSSYTGNLTQYDVQKLMVRELLVAGEVFLVLMKSADGYPQVQIVASEQVRSTGKRNDKTVDGLFLNDQGQVLSYQIYFTAKKPTVVNASDVIHLKRTKNVGQLRGISAFAASLNSLRDHRDLVLLEKKALKVHSALAASVTRKNNDVAMTGGLFGNPPVKSLQQTATTTPKPVSYKGIEKAFAGSVAYLGENEQVTLHSSNRSTDGFLKLLQLLSRDVCLNLSIPYDFVVSPEALTAAGIRFVISDTDVLIKNLQNLVLDNAYQRIYTWVIASAIKQGKLPKHDNYFNVSWVRPQSITVDIGRVSTAEMNFVEKGLLSYDKYYSARGLNWRDELRQSIQEKKFIMEECEKQGVEPSLFLTLPQSQDPNPPTP